MHPTFSFSSLKSFLQDAWTKNGLETLTAIQQQAIPAILAGKDLIAESPTGTGKTLAYIIPLLERIDPQRKNLQAVILAPTRELVMQIQQEIQKYAEGSQIRSDSFIGGADFKRQLEKLKQHPQVAVGTPGRIHELIKTKKMKMHEVKTVVVDEADHIKETEFQNTVKEIVKTTLRDRQLLFFSATISDQVEKESRNMMKDPQMIRIAKQDIPSSEVEHLYLICERRDKIDVLRRIVKMNPQKSIAFVNDTGSFMELAAKLKYKGIPLEVLHGEIQKTERERILTNFRAGKFPLLLSTDVAARGLDIEGITHVIHFDLPETSDQYVHRSGRTGRMGKQGTVISIITSTEVKRLQKFSNELGIPIHKKILYTDRLIDQKPFHQKAGTAATSKTGNKKNRSRDKGSR
jgi:superfamily II DNA/RNA helicase